MKTQKFPNNQVVVRGGESSPETLKKACAKDVRNKRGHISARSILKNRRVDFLAESSPFPNGTISFISVGEVRGLINIQDHWDVIDDPSSSPNHVAILCPYDQLTDKQAADLSENFMLLTNYWRK
ncbi:hypothetical protein [Paenibacillus lemnae]|uniref:Uncharacterized protein n=1 Tax=Paenibacillus lemnae TaxID=1330551 RepID=A0A848M3U6_PAELE|nr:hypothetical protein [Paenibacillus lemnae]NMO94929.1 hypothetical protein [Paenibacillus lemnae]